LVGLDALACGAGLDERPGSTAAGTRRPGHHTERRAKERRVLSRPMRSAHSERRSRAELPQRLHARRWYAQAVAARALARAVEQPVQPEPEGREETGSGSLTSSCSARSLQLQTPQNLNQRIFWWQNHDLVHPCWYRDRPQLERPPGPARRLPSLVLGVQVQVRRRLQPFESARPGPCPTIPY
jgi:hypothetical protein